MLAADADPVVVELVAVGVTEGVGPLAVLDPVPIPASVSDAALPAVLEAEALPTVVAMMPAFAAPLPVALMEPDVTPAVEFAAEPTATAGVAGAVVVLLAVPVLDPVLGLVTIETAVALAVPVAIAPLAIAVTLLPVAIVGLDAVPTLVAAVGLTTG